MNEAQERKERNENRLREIGVAVSPHLPLVESSEEIELRSPSEVANRILCLITLAAFVSGDVDVEVMMEWARGEEFYRHFSDDELEFLADENPPEERVIHMGWQIEAAVPLIWALGGELKLGLYLDQHGPSKVLPLIPGIGESTGEYIGKARLRPSSDILDQVDLIYRIHWAARDAQLKGQEVHPDWSYDVIMERHKALNWLVNYCDQEWDEVSTDT